MKNRDIGGDVIRIAAQLALAGAGLIACGFATAQQSGVHPGLQDRFTFQIGAYSPQADTTAFLNNSALARGVSASSAGRSVRAVSMQPIVPSTAATPSPLRPG